MEKLHRKLTKTLGGIKKMVGLPGVLFVIDSAKEGIAITEAQKLGIPIVAVVDTNGNPESIDYPIPGNDDAVRAIDLFTSKVAEAVIEGKKSRLEKEMEAAKAEEEGSAEEPGAVPEEETPEVERG